MKIWPLLLVLPFIGGSSCETESESDNSHEMSTSEKQANRLIDETSPYLLQHAYNPVNWYPWGAEAFAKAEEEDKLVLVSIGYSACHWCHVMEHECFENEELASIMNERFICIKVDREERPDVDQVYMDAINAMGQQGGWPLNVFTLPNGKPFWGGTYFPPGQWESVLIQLDSAYHNRRDEIIAEADRITQGVQNSREFVKVDEEANFNTDLLVHTIDKWKPNWDMVQGGPTWAPKFPIPNNYLFLLRQYYHSLDEKILEYVSVTLTKMAYGGIYDHVGGGFARYSTDSRWKVPHFEKMLYDNAQLVSLYAEAYQLTGNPLYKEIVEETLQFIQREMTSDEGAFYSAYDADSEGEEGKFYTWSKEELKEVLGAENYTIAEQYFELNSKGSWEGHFILLRDKDKQQVTDKLGMSVEELQASVDEIKRKLYSAREQRVWPGLDDKTLTSWNALMITGYADAYKVFGNEEYLNAAITNAQFIWDKQRQNDGALNHSYKNGKSTINGYLEDYSHTIEAYLAVYECTFDEVWLTRARELANYAIAHFYNLETGLFYFTSDLDDPLIARKTDVTDNVIPSSNSSMAKGLFLLGKYFDNKEYATMAEQMLTSVYQFISNSGRDLSNWSILLQWNAYPYYEVTVIGESAHTIRQEINTSYLPNILYAGSQEDSSMPLLELKYVKGETRIYVCQHKVCLAPTIEVTEAVEQIARE